jgi:hypothetical protein
VQGFIAEMRVCIKEQELAAREKEQNAAAQAALSARAPDPTAGSKKKLIGYIAGGTGLALIVTGVYFAFDAKSAQSEVEDHLNSVGTWTPEIEDVDSRGKRSNVLAIVLPSLGVAALATGGVFYYLGRQESRRARAGYAINFDGRNAMFTVGGEF